MCGYSGVSVDCPFDIDNSSNTMMMFPYYRPYLFDLGWASVFAWGMTEFFLRIGTWNVRSMHQGKLDIVKREMERIDVNLVGVSEMK